jgi:hypothetical protein
MPPPLPWSWTQLRPGRADREHILLWHGCLGRDAISIAQNGVDPTKGRADTDFGGGFYLCSRRRQAEYWAWERHRSLTLSQQTQFGSNPIVLRFRVRRADLAALEALHFFVLDDHDNEDFWSLVHHCRGSAPPLINNHKHTNSQTPDRRNWYDLVVGPVAAFWRQRVALSGDDQISFHTHYAAGMLTHLIRTGNSDDFRLVAVP